MTGHPIVTVAGIAKWADHHGELRGQEVSMLGIKRSSTRRIVAVSVSCLALAAITLGPAFAARIQQGARTVDDAAANQIRHPLIVDQSGEDAGTPDDTEAPDESEAPEASESPEKSENPERPEARHELKAVDEQGHDNDQGEDANDQGEDEQGDADSGEHDDSGSGDHEEDSGHDGGDAGDSGDSGGD